MSNDLASTKWRCRKSIKRASRSFLVHANRCLVDSTHAPTPLCAVVVEATLCASLTLPVGCCDRSLGLVYDLVGLPRLDSSRLG